MDALFDNNELALPDECPGCGLSFQSSWSPGNDVHPAYPIGVGDYYGGLVYGGWLVIPEELEFHGDPDDLCYGPFDFPVVCNRCGRVLYNEEGDCLLGDLPVADEAPSIDTIIATRPPEVE